MKKELTQLGVHPSVNVARSVFNFEDARLVSRFGLTPD